MGQRRICLLRQRLTHRASIFSLCDDDFGLQSQIYRVALTVGGPLSEPYSAGVISTRSTPEKDFKYRMDAGRGSLRDNILPNEILPKPTRPGYIDITSSSKN